MERFGFGNPMLLADGISEALLTTQAGLLVAFPLLLANTYIKRR
ncbi:MAG: MotA/TolQ/ExbB proton channel family protein [Candidatus Fibromonas sp.]|nr:MotA/TolQ/ExbB proton channel family protein [Candidatus Fibromonas sp.]